MGIITRNYDFENGTTADAEQVDAEFNTIYNEFNGHISDDNISHSTFLKTPATAPTTDYDVANKKYVDDLLSSGITDKTRHINLTPAGAIIPATGGMEQVQVDGTYHSYYVLNADKDNAEKAFWHFKVPEKYDGGALIINIVCKTSVNSGNVVFTCATRGCAEGETWDSNTDETTGSVTKSVAETADNEFIAVVSISDPKWTFGDTVYFKLTRDAANGSDTANADVSVLMVEINYEVV